MSTLVDILKAIIYLLSGVLTLLGTMWVLFFPLRNVPTREQEVTAPIEEMLGVYARYGRRCVVLACIYTLGAGGVWVASLWFKVLSPCVYVAVAIAVMAWAAVLVTREMIQGAKRRHKQGTYGQTTS